MVVFVTAPTTPFDDFGWLLGLGLWLLVSLAVGFLLKFLSCPCSIMVVHAFCKRMNQVRFLTGAKKALYFGSTYGGGGAVWNTASGGSIPSATG